MIEAVNRAGANVLPLEKMDEDERWKGTDIMERIRSKISLR